MPVAYATGTVTSLLRAGGVASGTAEATVTAPVAVLSGDLEVDRRAYRAFAARIRLMRPEVYVDDLDTPVAELAESVEVTEVLDEVVVTASFTVAKDEASPFHASPLLTGNRACRIELWIGPPGGAGEVNTAGVGSVGLGDPPVGYFLDGLPHAAIIGPGGLVKYPLFDGFTNDTSDGGAHGPRARVQAISGSSLWADTPGCVELNSFAGYTRAEILQMLAAASGVTVTGLEALPSARVFKPVDEMSLSVLELIRRYGQIEGWRARLSADGAGIEVLSEDRLLDGAPVYEFDESNTFSVSVATPGRPVTDWVLSGTRISMPIPTATPADEGPTERVTVTEGTDAEGNPIRFVETVRSFGGAEYNRISETYRTFAPDGEDDYPAGFQLTDRVAVVTEWADFVWFDNPVTYQGVHIRPSAQISRRVTETETMTGTRASADAPITYVWGEDRWLAANQTLTLIERVTETFNWDTTKCRLMSSLQITERPFSPRVDPAVATYYTYEDGSTRAAEFYEMTEVEKRVTSWTELDEAGSAPKTTMLEQFYSWLEVESPDTADVFVDTHKQTDQGMVVWQGNLADTAHTRTTTIISIGAMNSTEVITVDGPVPGSPRGSADVATLQQEVIVKVVRASAASGYIRREESPSAIDFAESIEELETWARRRLRRDHSIPVTVSHRMIPYLRVGDFVTVTNARKSMDAVEGYVSEIRRSISVLNGGAKQTTVVKVPPSWV